MFSYLSLDLSSCNLTHTVAFCVKDVSHTLVYTRQSYNQKYNFNFSVILSNILLFQALVVAEAELEDSIAVSASKVIVVIYDRFGIVTVSGFSKLTFLWLLGREDEVTEQEAAVYNLR